MLGGLMSEQQGLGNYYQAIGSQPARDLIPLKVGMRVLVTSSRPYRPGTIIALAPRYEVKQILVQAEYVMVDFGSSIFGKRKPEWEHSMNVAPILETKGESNE